MLLSQIPWGNLERLGKRDILISSACQPHLTNTAMFLLHMLNLNTGNGRQITNYFNLVPWDSVYYNQCSPTAKLSARVVHVSA